MKCHYKVLEIEDDADDTQIKAAYRKLALKWHPDKNLSNGEYAKEQFQLVQQAYEILSDRQERAWYDKHRDQILHQRDYEDNALDVFQFFTTTCFKGFGDGDKGFYTVYREVFEKIAVEDIEHTDKEEFTEVPTFGYSTSDYDEVVGPFYSYWMSYNTKKSYSWLNPHNLQEVRDRRIYKLVDKENKKIRSKAKKERNEEVRALVGFVRKRDKRVQENIQRMEAKVIENRQKQEELRKQKLLERHKELSDAKPLAEWTKFDNVENDLKGIEKSLAQEFGEELSNDESNDSSDLDHLYCVACNKGFKTAKGFENHESSKKHKQNVEILKESMLQEEQLDNLIDNDTESTSEVNGDISSSEDVDTEPQTNHKKKKKKKSRNIIQIDEMHENEDVILDSSKLKISDDDLENTSFNETNNKKQKRKSKSAIQNSGTNSNKKLDEKDEEESSIEINKNRKKGKSKNKGKIEATDLQLNDHTCVTCKAKFSSNNKLFDHLKKTNHSVLLSTASSIQHKNKKCSKK